MKKKVLAAVLAAGMVMTMIPAAAYADAVEEDTQLAVELDSPDEEGAAPAADAAADVQEVVDEEAAAEQEVAGTEEAAVEVDTAGLFSWELEEIGRFSSADDYTARYDAIMKEEGDGYIFCDVNGNTMLDSYHVRDVDYFGWGIYAVSLDTGEEDVNNTALVSINGDVLVSIDEAAAFFELPTYHTEDVCPRYILAYYGTEVTDNEDEALFFVTDRMIALSADDEDTLYKGTLKVFDLVERQFVPGLEYSRATDSDFEQVGENLLVDIDTKTVYSPAGEVVYEEKGYLNNNYKYMTDRVADRNVILDENGTELFSSASSISPINYDSEYFTLRGDSGYQVINASGETVLDGPFYTVYKEMQNRFRVKVGEEDEEETLVGADGSVIIEGEDFEYEDELGFFCWGEDDNLSLLTPDNRRYDGLSGQEYSLFFSDEEAGTFMALNTGEFLPFPCENVDSMGKGLLRAYNESGFYGLYDLFTGEELLGFEYDGMSMLGEDMLAVQKGDEVVVYGLNLKTA